MKRHVQARPKLPQSVRAPSAYCSKVQFVESEINESSVLVSGANSASAGLLKLMIEPSFSFFWLFFKWCDDSLTNPSVGLAMVEKSKKD